MKRVWLLLMLAVAAARAEMLVSSFNGGQVLRYDYSTGAFLGVLVSDPSVQLPHETVFAFDLNLYVASANNDRVLRCSPSDGSILATLQTNGVALDYPAGMTLGADGLLYVSSQLNDSILRYDPATGALVDTFVTAGSGGLDGPSGVVLGPGGDLYVAGRFANRVYRYSGADGSFVSVFVTSNLAQPFGLRFGPDQHLYVASGNSNHVAKFDGTSGAFLGVFTSGGALSLPVGLAFGPDTNLYVANFGGNTVARFDGQTGIFLGNVMASGSGGLNGPNFITFRPEPRAAPIVHVSVANDGGTNHLVLHVAKGTNTGPVRVGAEVTDDLPSGAWQGGTNVVILEDTPALFRARDARPITVTTQRFLRATFSAP